MSDELTVGHIEELSREHGPTRLTLPSVNGYVIVGDVLKELRKAKEQIAHHARALAERDEEIARLKAERDGLDCTRREGGDSRHCSIHDGNAGCIRCQRDRLAAKVDRVRALYAGAYGAHSFVAFTVGQLDAALRDEARDE